MPSTDRISVHAMPPSGPLGYWPTSSSSQLSRRMSKTSVNMGSPRRGDAGARTEPGTDGHDQQREDQVQHGREQVGLEGAEAQVLDFLDGVCQLGSADRHREAAVLEQR